MPPSLIRPFARHLHASVIRNALSHFAMPAMSPTMTEGGIAGWKKAEGESFSAGDVLLEIETDKATIDVEAQDDGILAKIIVQDGTKNIAVGSAIAIVGEQGDSLEGIDELVASASQKPSAKSGSAAEPPPKAENTPSKSDDASPILEKTPPATPQHSSTPSFGGRTFASPIAKKIALEQGIPLAKVKGTGPDGRITRQDVESYNPLPAAPGPAASKFPSIVQDAYTDIPVSNMRRVIGTRLTQSKQEVPHYYLTVDIQMDKLLKMRQVLNSTLAEKAVKLSINDFIVKAVACALADVPEANSAWLGEVIRQYHQADISVAVATPTGLITPIIKDVGSKGLAAISAEAKLLANKARDGKLTPQEYQGGTFTISNLGMFDVSHFTAIINPPQSCILAVGSTQPKIVPTTKDGEGHGFATAQIMKATLSSDHRTVDGVVAARWMTAFKSYLENPLTFML